ncbi:MAG: metal-dependent transcriptional regulator [Actinomycetaceae bacterium]|nr:metal-dependent transcriptional regulator [Actinomycetaceae bacterium]
MSAGLVDTTEMYLKAIYELEEEGVPPMRARLVERLEQSKPTVSETVARLERQGLLFVDSSRIIQLTDEGRRQATAVMRKHRLAECLLFEVLGMDWELVHNEACGWEHVMSDKLEERIAVAIGKDAHRDPYGNPIPENNSLGPAGDVAGEAGLMSVADYLADSPAGGTCRLARIGESLQTDEDLLREFAAAGIQPDAELRLKSGDGVVTLEGESGLPVEITAPMRAHLQLYS